MAILFFAFQPSAWIIETRRIMYHLSKFHDSFINKQLVGRAEKYLWAVEVLLWF